jgi:hypothetical protein
MSENKNPPLDNPLLVQLTPHLSRRRRFKPEAGGRITVMLPGESVSCLVLRVVNDDAVIAPIGTVFFTKHHQYRAGEVVPARRSFDQLLGTEYWAVVSSRAQALAEAVAEFERAEAALTGPAAPEVSPMPDIGQADIGIPHMAPPTVPLPTPDPAGAVGLPEADTDHRSSTAPDAVETRIVKGKDGTLKRESKPRRGRGKPPQPHQA